MMKVKKRNHVKQVRMRNCVSLAFPAGFGNSGLLGRKWLFVQLDRGISQIEYGNCFGIKEKNTPSHAIEQKPLN